MDSRVHQVRAGQPLRQCTWLVLEHIGEPLDRAPEVSLGCGLAGLRLTGGGKVRIRCVRTVLPWLTDLRLVANPADPPGHGHHEHHDGYDHKRGHQKPEKSR